MRGRWWIRMSSMRPWKKEPRVTVLKPTPKRLILCVPGELVEAILDPFWKSVMVVPSKVTATWVHSLSGTVSVP